MKCWIEGGCGCASIPHNENDRYNCCVVSVHVRSMEKKGFVRVSTISNAEVVSNIDVPTRTGIVSFRSSWRSRHRTELTEGLYVIDWAARIADSTAPFLVKREAIRRYLAEPDSLDVLKTMFHIVDQNMILEVSPQWGFDARKRRGRDGRSIEEHDGDAVRSIAEGA